nr:MAG TPA: hypothetical protein [Caudoviricetes sp.]
MDGRTVNASALLTATVNCAPAGHSILRLWRGPSSRACSAGGMAVFSYRKWHSSPQSCL